MKPTSCGVLYRLAVLAARAKTKSERRNNARNYLEDYMYSRVEKYWMHLCKFRVTGTIYGIAM